MVPSKNIYPEFHRMPDRRSKERQLRQRGHVFWLYGLSGSGKSTLANALERGLMKKGIVTKILDGDNIRSRLNGDLGFSDADRKENVRRIAEVARLFLESGIVVFTSLITPKRDLRHQACAIVGAEDVTPVFVKASFETCAKRDVKGLYARAAEGEVKRFTGKDSSFEEPCPEDGDWIVSTEKSSPQESFDALLGRVLPIVRKSEEASGH